MNKFKIERGIIEYSKKCNNFTIMLDKEAGEIWIDIFSDCNSWKEYRSKSIVAIGGGTGNQSIYGWSGITIKRIKELAQEAMSE